MPGKIKDHCRHVFAMSIRSVAVEMQPRAIPRLATARSGWARPSIEAVARADSFGL